MRSPGVNDRERMEAILVYNLIPEGACLVCWLWTTLMQCGRVDILGPSGGWPLQTPFSAFASLPGPHRTKHLLHGPGTVPSTSETAMNTTPASAILEL